MLPKSQQRFIKTAKNEECLPVRLVLCLDGTGDTIGGSYNAHTGVVEGENDSIVAIFNMVKAGPVENPDGEKLFQHVEYFEGIGTLRITTADALGVLFGYGYRDILRNAYKVCCEELQQVDKDEIFLFGFSRGAFISRALASFLQYVGLVKPEHMRSNDDFTQLFEKLVAEYGRVKGAKVKPGAALSHSLQSYCRPSPRVRFIGAFDTVKAVVRASPLEVDFDMDAPALVDHFRHALALNEVREIFNPDVWKSDVHPGCTYHQAWFFGHHHDIGGGSAQQGLALWPLQWILNSARDYGLVLDSGIEVYKILFTGAQKAIDTPDKVSINMLDMIDHNRSNTPFALRLNPPHVYGLREPRNYKNFLPKDPFGVKPKMFLHPSAYLIFDVSSSFRIQVQAWKYFRQFMEARPGALAPTVPWWEEQAIKRIWGEATAVEHLNLLVYGRPETGKTDLIRRVFGESSTGKGGSLKPLAQGLAKGHTINTPLTIPGNNQVRIHYSNGFGTGGSDTTSVVESFLAKYRDVPGGKLGDQLHAVWFFVDSTKQVLGESDKTFLRMDFGDIPVHVILGNEKQLENEIRQDLSDNSASGFDVSPEIKEKQVAVIKNKIEQVKEVRDVRKNQKVGKSAATVRSIVRTASTGETLEVLSRETFASVESSAVRIALIKAQRVMVRPKIALATEESIRAYMIWHSFKFAQKNVSFSRNKGKEKLTLPLMLIEPVLATFNARFPGDDQLIQSGLGSGWTGLDQHKLGLHDPTIPGGLILMCMIDTIITMTRALSHQQVNGRARKLTDPAQPLLPADIKDACTWYTSSKITSSRQAAMHEKIKSMLSEKDGSPIDESITKLQMKLIETVDIESGKAEENTASIISRLLGWGRG